ncbi:MAG TPA: LacI family DNA-binding transcriptional regulator [Acidobacteriaceae bacterium]
MAVRLKDIAADLGVSTVTVSKVLRGGVDIGERTRARVLKRMAELNYQPNMQARGLASGRSFAVGLVVPDLVHPFFGEFAKSLAGALRASGLALVLASSEEDPEIERQEIRTLVNRGVDVLLVASCQRAETAELFTQKGLPILLIDRNLPGLGTDFVGSNDVLVGELATRHLIGLGRRRLAHIGGQGTSPSIDRFKGFRNALGTAGIRLPKSYVVTRERFEETGDSAGYRAMQELLAQKQRPDAVFCYNDLSAIGAMQATMQAGLNIPGDIAFAGCGNLRYAEYLKVPLTSVDQAIERMGETAARRALALSIKPDDLPQTAFVEPKLIVRQSSVAG